MFTIKKQNETFLKNFKPSRSSTIGENKNKSNSDTCFVFRRTPQTRMRLIYFIILAFILVFIKYFGFA